MYTIRVLVNVQCANGCNYQITTNVSLETCRTLLKVKTHCLAMGRLNAASSTTFLVNDAEELDEGYILQPTDSVEITVIDETVAPSSTAASASAVSPSSTAASASAVDPSSTAASASVVSQGPSYVNFHFITTNNYHDWENLNAIAVLDCWAACIPNKNIKFGSVSFIAFFFDYN
jgi:hypothetical protein